MLNSIRSGYERYSTHLMLAFPACNDCSRIPPPSESVQLVSLISVLRTGEEIELSIPAKSKHSI